MNNKYRGRLGKACDYISENLDEDLLLDDLSQVVNISKYHFNRLFSTQLGVSVYSYIQLQRFKRASYQLVFNTDLKVIDIALDARFDSPEAFSRAFKKVFKVTPTEFRNNPNWENWHDKYKFTTLTGEKKMDVKIIEFNKMDIAVLEHCGSPTLLNNSIAKFIDWRKTTGQSPIKSSRTFGVVYSDPNNTHPEQFRFDACGEVVTNVLENKYGVIQKVIPKGNCAVIRHIGSHDTMEEKVYYLYKNWLPESNQEIRDFPLFFEYLNFFPEVAENDLITDIYLPIK